MARGISTAVLFLALLAYWPAIQSGFIWDDDDYVTENRTLRSTEGLRQVWFEPGATPQYYPLVFSSYWIEYGLWGLEPTGYHITNLVLHLLAGVLLWRCLTTLSVPYAWLVAAVFVLHPVHVESVAWISERKNVLSLVFYLGSALLLIRYFRLGADAAALPRKWSAYAPALALFLAALLSKTVSFSLPAATLLIIWWRSGRIRYYHVISMIPFFLLGIAGGLTTTWLEHHHVGAQGADWDYGLVERILIAGRVIWFYAYKLLFPVQLTFNYPRWSVDATVWWQYLYPAAVVALLILLWSYRHRIGRGPLAATLFFCGTLFPALGFIDVYPFRYSFVADHFQYHASIGLIVFIVAIMMKYLKRTPLAVRRLVVAMILLTLAGRSHLQGYDYVDQETLWRRTLQRNPASWMAHNNLGVIERRRGENEQALVHYQAVLQLLPNNSEALNNIGSIYYRNGEYERALSYYHKAIAANPENALAHANLAMAFASKGSRERALYHYRKVVRIAPKLAAAHSRLGLMLLEDGDDQAALHHIRRAGMLAPDSVQYQLDLGIGLTRTGQLEEAVDVYLHAAVLSPQQIEIYNNLGGVYGAMQRYDDAIGQFKKALHLDQSYDEARINLGIALAQAGDLTEAKRQLEMVVETTPESVSALKSYTQTQWLLGEYEQARDSFQRLRAVSRDHAALLEHLIPDIANGPGDVSDDRAP